MSGVDAGSPDLGVDKVGSSSSDACKQNFEPLNITQQPAQLLVLLDRSTSMQKTFDGTTREAAVQDALIAVIKRYQSRVKFGFMHFPADTTDPPCQAGSCCSGSVSNPPTISNLDAMTSSVQCLDWHGAGCQLTNPDSPSYAALDKVREYYRWKDSFSSDDRYVLLVTSSEPSCAADSSNLCDDAISSASDLSNSNVHIVVLTLDYQPDPSSCLYQISQLGSSALPLNIARSISARNVSDLASSLDIFVAAVERSACTMTTSPPIPRQATISISIDTGNEIAQVDGEGQDGWYIVNFNRNKIRFSGSACEEFLNSQVTSPDASYSCCDGPYACSPWRP